MPRFGNSSVSSLLTQARSAFERTQTYNDSIAAYEYDLSDKTAEDFEKYASYLKSRITKTSDPSKALSLQKTITSANRSFRSNEIARASMAVNYGDMDDTGKYNKMYGLMQDAIANGDYSQAQSIEAQMASLSIKIQNAQQAAAGRAAASGKANYNKSIAERKAIIQDLENKYDRAYQTGQPIKLPDGTEKRMNAADYAMNQATILAQKYNLLQQLAADDPGDPTKLDDISRLEKSAEYRGLIDSGLIRFDEQGNPVASEGIKNLAVSFKKDNYGNTVRSFTSPEMKDGQQQWGLSAGEDGMPKGRFVVNRQLDNKSTDPTQLGRVSFDAKAVYGADGKKMDGVLERYSGTQRGDLISGNRVLIDEKTGLQAVVYNSKKEKRSVEETRKELDMLANLKPYKQDALADFGDYLGGTAVGNATQAVNEAGGAAIKGGAGLIAKNGLQVAGRLPGPLGAIANMVDFGAKKRRLEAARVAAEQANARAQAERAKQQQAAQQRMAAQARISQLNAAANRRTPSILYQPRPLTLQQKVSNLAAATTPRQVASGIGDIVGYNAAIKKLGW